MEDILKIKILNLLKKDNVLSFTSNGGMQGGPIVDIILNNKSIGEVYTYNSVDNRYENIPHGNLFELELANALNDWVHFDFFEFVCENDHLLRDFHDCSFRLEKEKIMLEISIKEEDDMGEEMEFEGEKIYESFEYYLTDIEK